MPPLTKHLGPLPSTDDNASLGESWLVSSYQWLAPVLRRATWLLLAAAFAVVAFRVVAHFQLGVIWDDAFIFQRYAQNVRAGDGWAWQPGGEPTYGTTSLAFILVILPLQALTENAGLSAMLASTIGGAAFLATTPLLIRSVKASRAVTLISTLVFFLCCAWSALPDHFTTGMDTMFSLTYLVLYLWSVQRFEHHNTRANALWLGLMGGVAFAVRPDLLVFCVFIPATWMLLSKERLRRRYLFEGLCIAGALTVITLAVNAWYFQSALPLPFFAKSTRLYGNSMQRVYRGVSSENMIHFLAGCWPLVMMIALDLLAGPRKWWQRTNPLDKAALLSAVLFGSYYWFVALPVMSMSQRFLQPLLPMLLWIAMRTAARWESEHKARATIDAAGRWGLSLAACFGLTMVTFMLWPRITEHGTAFVRAIAHHNLRFDMKAHAATKGPQSYWYKLSKVSELPDDVVIATTEVGFVGALNPNKKVIDMAGLNERAFAHKRFDADTFLNQHKPDFIYMPHVDYKTMRETLINNPAFKDYDYFSNKRLRVRAFGVALRRSSPHYTQMRKLLPKNLNGQAHLKTNTQQILNPRILLR